MAKQHSALALPCTFLLMTEHRPSGTHEKKLASFFALSTAPSTLALQQRFSTSWPRGATKRSSNQHFNSRTRWYPLRPQLHLRTCRSTSPTPPTRAPWLRRLALLFPRNEPQYTITPLISSPTRLWPRCATPRPRPACTTSCVPSCQTLKPARTHSTPSESGSRSCCLLWKRRTALSRRWRGGAQSKVPSSTRG